MLRGAVIECRQAHPRYKNADRRNHIREDASVIRLATMVASFIVVRIISYLCQIINDYVECCVGGKKLERENK